MFFHRRVIRRVNHHRHALVILRRAAEHGRPADVNVLNGVVQRRIRFGDRLLERVEIHHDEIDVRDALPFAVGDVLRLRAVGEDRAEDFRRERLHASAEAGTGAKQTAGTRAARHTKLAVAEGN